MSKMRLERFWELCAKAVERNSEELYKYMWAVHIDGDDYFISFDVLGEENIATLHRKSGDGNVILYKERLARDIFEY